MRWDVPEHPTVRWIEATGYPREYWRRAAGERPNCRQVCHSQGSRGIFAGSKVPGSLDSLRSLEMTGEGDDREVTISDAVYTH